jgi:hypothetical protein
MAALKRILFSGTILLACVGFALTPTNTQAVPSVPSISVTTHQVFLPIAHHAECKTHTASMGLSATATTLHVGEVVTVTAGLSNEGCVALGLPLYSLSWDTDETEPIFEATTPLEVVHYLAVVPGEYDEAQFVLRAVGAAQATLRAYASFEVHLGYPGPAYWGSASAPPLVITVMP